MQEEKPVTIKYYPIKDWIGGDSNGFTEPSENTIHVIRGEDLELKMILHEKIHLQRKNKLTFRLGSLILTPYQNILMLLLVGLSFAIVSSVGFIMLGFYTFLIFCVFYEEKTTWKLTNKKLKEINE